MNKYIENAYKVLNEEDLTRREAVDLLEHVDGVDVLDLISLANKVRVKFAGDLTRCSIVNAKSGKCAQNCRFCAQSAHSQTGIETYPLLSEEEMMADAEKVYVTGVRKYGIVTSGWGYKDPENEEFCRIISIIKAIKKRFPDLDICVSIGILSEDCARALAEAGAWRYNMNLQTNPSRYAELIATTHTIQEKIDTIKYLQKYGMTICCGGIIGLGESRADRVEMAFAAKELDVEGIPVNILLPIPGTPLEKNEVLDPAEAAKTFAMFRLVNPSRMIKFAAGRETVMKDFQALLMLSGASSIITGGYLTTRGRSVEDDERMLRQLKNFS